MSPFQTPASASGTVGVPPGQQPNAAAPDARPWRRPRRADLLALAVWAGSRVVLLLISLGALASQHGTSWLGLWQRWDWDRYLTIAQYGYTSGKGPAYDSDIVAFFPGYPLLLRAVHFVVRNWVVSGLLISLVAGAVACIALSRLAAFEWRARLPHDDDHGASDGSGRAAVTAVLLLVCARRDLPGRRVHRVAVPGAGHPGLAGRAPPSLDSGRDTDRAGLHGADRRRVRGRRYRGDVPAEPPQGPRLGSGGRSLAAGGGGRRLLRLPEGHHRRLAGLVPGRGAGLVATADQPGHRVPQLVGRCLRVRLGVRRQARTGRWRQAPGWRVRRATWRRRSGQPTRWGARRHRAAYRVRSGDGRDRRRGDDARPAHLFPVASPAVA